MRFLYFLLFSLVPLFLQAQNSFIRFTNAQPIEENRYPDIKGSPYFFEEFAIGTITDKDGKTYPDLLINYNGYENEFEIRKGKQYIALDEQFYQSLELFPNGKDAPSLLFIKDYVLQLKSPFVLSIHRQEGLHLFKEIDVRLNEVKTETPGETKISKRFLKKNTYYIALDDKLHPIKLKKKSVLAVFDQSKELEKYIKKEKLKLSSEEDLVRLIAFYGTL